MSSYSEDLRRRIVLAVEDGMSKAQAARTFSVSLSSLKRYLNKVQRGESLAPKKRPGSLPKLDEKARASYSKMTSKNAPTSPSRIAVSTSNS
jgi:transposase